MKSAKCSNNLLRNFSKLSFQLDILWFHFNICNFMLSQNIWLICKITLRIHFPLRSSTFNLVRKLFYFKKKNLSYVATSRPAVLFSTWLLVNDYLKYSDRKIETDKNKNKWIILSSMNLQFNFRQLKIQSENYSLDLYVVPLMNRLILCDRTLIADRWKVTSRVKNEECPTFTL